jgi:hypothetical protein
MRHGSLTHADDIHALLPPMLHLAACARFLLGNAVPEMGGFVMYRILLAAAALVATAGFVHAAVPNLAGTTWYTTDDGCVFDEVTFAADGTASLYMILEDESDTVKWLLDGNTLAMAYVDWDGGEIAGTVFPDHIDLVHVWKSLETKKTHEDACVLEPG